MHRPRYWWNSNTRYFISINFQLFVLTHSFLRQNLYPAKFTLLSIQFNRFEYVYKAVQSPSLSNSRTFSSSVKETTHPVAVSHAPFTPPPGPWQSTVAFLSLRTCLFCIFCMNGIIQYLGLDPFTQHDVFKSPPHCSLYQYFIPLCGCTIFHLFFHNLFFQSSIDKY